MTLAVKYSILGFGETKNMEFSAINEVLVGLKSFDGEDFPLVFINPYLIRLDHGFEISTCYQELLSLTPESGMKIFSTVATVKSIEESIVNFLASVVISPDSNSIVQVILDTVAYLNFSQADQTASYIKK